MPSLAQQNQAWLGVHGNVRRIPLARSFPTPPWHQRSVPVFLQPMAMTESQRASQSEWLDHGKGDVGEDRSQGDKMLGRVETAVVKRSSELVRVRRRVNNQVVGSSSRGEPC